MGVPGNAEILLGDPNSKDCSILGSILAPPPLLMETTVSAIVA